MYIVEHYFLAMHSSGSGIVVVDRQGTLDALAHSLAHPDAAAGQSSPEQAEDF
jgi:hypothetical protein